MLEYAETTYEVDEYSDNLCITRQDNEIEVREYWEAERHGCCGFHDTELTVTEPDGSTSVILFGYNYGH